MRPSKLRRNSLSQASTDAVNDVVCRVRSGVYGEMSALWLNACSGAPAGGSATSAVTCGTVRRMLRSTWTWLFVSESHGHRPPPKGCPVQVRMRRPSSENRFSMNRRRARWWQAAASSVLPAGCRHATSGAAIAFSIDRSMPKHDSHPVAAAKLPGAESRCRIWASTIEGARSRLSLRNVAFEHSRRRVSDIKRVCILTESAGGADHRKLPVSARRSLPGRCHCLSGHAVVGIVDAERGE
ncbi:hypothetical protein ABIC01_008771 [Bradyrhizobium sp. RT4b]